MKSSLIAKLKLLKNRYEEIEFLLSKSSINYPQFQKLSREYLELSEIVQYFLQWQNIQKNIKDITLLLKDSEMKDLADDELNKMFTQKAVIEKKLKILLLSKDPNDENNCYIEIRAGTGGNEAALFVNDLFKMYSNYAMTRGWNLQIISYNEAEQGGYKTLVIKVTGKKAYGRLKFESGGHRVQRVPKTESQGRIHTSTCTVAVMPELPPTELVKIKMEDLKIDTFRSSGAGGQHVNTTDSAIRITHLPTGIVVECQDERSQHKNKAKALGVLKSRIHAAEITKIHQEESKTRRNLLGTGDRHDRSRTYNFPQGRVTDHRINLTIYSIEDIMAGKLDIFIDPLLQEHQANQLIKLLDDQKTI
ncbi:MAG: peptide chain release factor 1 [Candidatus Dasytiphilus stammeri]